MNRLKQIAPLFLALLTGFLPVAHAQKLLLDFGPTPVAASNATASLAHFAGAVPATEISWNTITNDTGALIHSDGTVATGISVNLGRSVSGGNTIDFNDDGFLATNALGAQINTGIYIGNSPMKDGIYGGSGGGNALAVGARIDGLSPGLYTVYFAGRNTSTAASAPQRFFCTNRPSAGTFLFLTNANIFADLANSSPAVTGNFVLGNNCNYLVVTLGAGDSLYLASVGTTNVSPNTAGELRGFMNAVVVVPGGPVLTNFPDAFPLPLPVVSVEENRLTLTYSRAKTITNRAYTVGVSSNLLDWSSGSNHLDEFVLADNGAIETRVARDKSIISSRPTNFLRLKVSPKIQGAKVVCFGDSITAGSGVPANTNWVSQLQSRFSLTMINAGVGGNTSSQGLARIQSDVLAHNPNFVIINFGMNDHVMDALDAPKVTPVVFQGNLISMIDRVRTNNAIPILVTVNYIIEGDATQYYYSRHPAAYYANAGGAEAWMNSYVQIVRNVAASKQVDLVDVNVACAGYNKFEFLRSLLNAANDDDGVHPYLLGSNVYAQLIGDYLAAHY